MCWVKIVYRMSRDWECKGVTPGPISCEVYLVWWAASLDLKDAYLYIPIYSGHQKFLQFIIRDFLSVCQQHLGYLHYI